jgi:hypothetical protein
VSVKNLSNEEGGDDDSDAEEECNDSVTLDDIRKQMFDTDNVVIKKSTDHGFSSLTENQKPEHEQCDEQCSSVGGEDSFYSSN